MRKKILIGSLLVLTLLLLMPSIPAIQHNLVRDEINEISEDLYIDKIKKLIESGKLDNVKHPLLYFLFCMRMLYRHVRIVVLDKYTYEMEGSKEIIKLPILFTRLVMLEYTTIWYFIFWHFLSCISEWNWNKNYPNYVWEYFPW